ncbi:PA2169 family four-helix-bundle protein [Olivibacter sp. XZL3]|uniref:PA2169 family four-helix-bundle protein n=1 Tax=Olivibacter sp. XZL3 TaxID=1735116 RepID=UPI001065C97E|nr:PA2169 family four-helix-bundle protein [Olivibacter sp. XZL3]
MESLEAKTPILNDLVQLNNDRIAGYQKAIDKIGHEDAELKTAFDGFITQSRQFLTELKEELEHSGGAIAGETSTEGSLFRGWMDISGIFTDDKRRSILRTCVEGEKAIYDAYAHAEKTEELPSDTRFLLSQQKQQLKLASNKVITLYTLEKEG